MLTANKEIQNHLINSLTANISHTEFTEGL